jgi:hypothetical protein
LAFVEIQAAQGASPQRIAEDQDELGKGDADVSQGRYESGIEHYRNTWMHALHLKIVGFGTLPDGAVRLQFVALAGERCAILASTDMINWAAIGTCTATADGVIEFNDLYASHFSARFYRAMKLP